MRKLKEPSKRMIKTARAASSLTQTQAAELIGYSMRSWQDWESGITPMRRIIFDQFVTMINQEWRK